MCTKWVESNFAEGRNMAPSRRVAVTQGRNKKTLIAAAGKEPASASAVTMLGRPVALVWLAADLRSA